MERVDNKVVHNDAKLWQIGFFALNNTATNLYMFFFMFISYYATGIAGLLVVTVSSILTFMRIWDGFTDPIIGYFIDRTESKLGKFRPFMFIGNIILALMALVLVKTTHLVPEGIRLFYFILIYALYIIGYTFQTACTKAAQTVLTNNPKQRPLFTLFDAIYNTVLFVGLQVFVSMVLVPKYGGFTQGFFDEFIVYIIIASFVFTLLSISSIWKKDVKENWGGVDAQKVKFKEYLEVIKGNKPLQMLIIAASTDKMASSAKSNAVTSVIIFGVIMGNYSLSGTLAMITIPFTILLTVIGIGFARKLGQKKAYVVSTWVSMILSFVLLFFFLVIDTKSISLSNINLTTIIYLAISILIGGAASVGGNIVIPMIADTSDYETYKSGKYIPGMISTIFSFVDKLISSLATAIVGILLATIGFKEAFPTVDTPASSGLFWMGMFFFIGLPILGWIASIIAMKWYYLDGKKMEEIQKALHERKVCTE